MLLYGGSFPSALLGDTGKATIEEEPSLQPLEGYPQLSYVNRYYVTLEMPPILAGKENIMTNIEITTEFIKLQDLLKFANVVGSGGEAKIIIQEGEVMVNGEVCTQRGKKIRPGDTVELGELQLTVSYAD